LTTSPSSWTRITGVPIERLFGHLFSIERLWIEQRIHCVDTLCARAIERHQGHCGKSVFLGSKPFGPLNKTANEFAMNCYHAAPSMLFPGVRRPLLKQFGLLLVSRQLAAVVGDAKHHRRPLSHPAFDLVGSQSTSHPLFVCPELQISN
jgi:hypothetical protein